VRRRRRGEPVGPEGAGADARAAGRSTGPSSWDGYAATVVCDAAVEANRSGQKAPVRMRERPDLYRDADGATNTD